jgi:DNA-binding HxlR family transcriptional regulator
MEKSNFEDINKNDFGDAANCPVRMVIDRIGGKWTMLTLIMLHRKGKMRFNDIKREIGEISQKMLTQTLRVLEADSYITRKAYPEIPPRVEYELTDLGRSIVPILDSLAYWALNNMDAIVKSRTKYKTPENQWQKEREFTRVN